MTKEEYEAKEREILARVPPEFHTPLSRLAWEEFHSYGYHEVLLHLDDYVDAVAPAVEAYTARITATP